MSDRQTDRWTDRHGLRQTDGQTDKQADGQTDTLIQGQFAICFLLLSTQVEVLNFSFSGSSGKILERFKVNQW